MEGMDFPIANLMSEKASTEWILEHFHPNGLRCPHCGAAWAEASAFRTTRKSQLTVYRCKHCHGIYNLYSGTIFAARHLPPQEVVLLVRGVLKGESAATLAREMGRSKTTITALRHLIQTQAAQLQPETPLADQVVEADELFQNAGEKKRRTFRPARPAASSGE
jgi:transposase-like protein